MITALRHFESAVKDGENGFINQIRSIICYSFFFFSGTQTHSVYCAGMFVYMCMFAHITVTLVYAVRVKPVDGFSGFAFVLS